MSAVRAIDQQLGSAVAELEQRFMLNNPRSVSRYEQACKAMPGGNTRTVLHYSPLPLAIERAQGCTVWDLDGHEYIDYLCEFSAGLYGHSHPVITEAIEKALHDGVVLGGPNRFEAKLAQALVDRFPSIDLIRFCNSGSEANLMAVSTAKAVTGRDKIMVFDDAYHGGFLMFGHGGSPLNAPFTFVVGQYNDVDHTLALIEREKNNLAAVILEPFQFASGCIDADLEFLQAVRDATSKHDIVLIFDEVVTSRLGSAGVQGLTQVVPDMTALGKYLGGGLTFGAFGGRDDIMRRFDPRDEHAFAHAGTFNNNVLTMAAGYTGLSEIYTSDAAGILNTRGDDLRLALNAVLEKHAIDARVIGKGSIMNLHFTRATIRRASDIPDSPQQRKLFHLAMLERGIYMAARGVIVLSLPMTDKETDALILAFEDVMTEYAPLLAA